MSSPALLPRPATRGRGAIERLVPVLVAALWMLLSGPLPAIGESQPANGGSGALAFQGPPASVPASRRVLLLYGEPRLTPAIVAGDAAIRSTLESRSPIPVSFYTEYLDLSLFNGAVPLPELRELLRRKYEDHPVDLIVAGGSPVLRIAVHNRAALFSKAPVVFVSVDPTAAADLPLDTDVTGTWLRQGWAETLELARHLQPDVRQAVVVTGSSPVDRVWRAAARAQLGTGTPVEVTHLSDLSFEDILNTVRGLPMGSVVLVGVFLRDATGRDFRTPEAVRRIAAAASVPVYGLTDTVVGTGVVGGHVVSFETHGKVAAELALRVLAGERPAATYVDPVPMFDARQLARWGLSAGRLPPGSHVLFQEPSLWGRYHWYFVGAAAALLVQGGLIGVLLVQRGQRRRAQDSLTERLRFETLLSNLSAILAASPLADADQQIEAALRRLVETLSVDWATIRVLEPRALELAVTHTWTEAEHQPRPRVIRANETPWIYAQLRQGYIVRVAGPGSLPDEASVDRRTLEALDVRSAVLVPLGGERGLVGCLSIGTARGQRHWPDEWTPRLRLLAEAFAHALERQRSEKQVRDLAGRLLTAQEEERRRIARDLHDDVNQELVAQTLALGSLRDRLADVPTPGVREEVAGLRSRVMAVSRAIRQLSHSLHPGVLEHVGLVAALRGYCGEFAHEHGVPVLFDGDDQLGMVLPDVGLCLYRVTQEGLGNVARHAGARHARVTLEREGDDLVLTIGDDGRGFDRSETRDRQGLGLISLDERVRLVGGRLTIDSQSQRGTELRITVPLSRVWNGSRDATAR